MVPQLNTWHTMPSRELYILRNTRPIHIPQRVSMPLSHLASGAVETFLPLGECGGVLFSRCETGWPMRCLLPDGCVCSLRLCSRSNFSGRAHGTLCSTSKRLPAIYPAYTHTHIHTHTWREWGGREEALPRWFPGYSQTLAFFCSFLLRQLPLEEPRCLTKILVWCCGKSSKAACQQAARENSSGRQVALRCFRTCPLQVCLQCSAK